MNPEAEFKFVVDKETKRLLEIALWCLITKFGLSYTAAIDAIEGYHALDHPFDTNEDWYHHEGPYWIALRIVHRLSNDSDKTFPQWRVEHGYTDVPADVLRSIRIE